MDVMAYIRRVTVSDAAGIATEYPIVILVASLLRTNVSQKVANIRKSLTHKYHTIRALHNVDFWPK